MSASKPSTPQVPPPAAEGGPPNTKPSHVKPPVLPLDSKGRPYHTGETARQDYLYTASRTDLGKRKVW